MTTAGKLQMIMELLGGLPIHDEHGEVIGYTPQIISPEQAKNLLNMPEEKDEPETK